MRVRAPRRVVHPAVAALEAAAADLGDASPSDNGPSDSEDSQADSDADLMQSDSVSSEDWDGLGQFLDTASDGESVKSVGEHSQVSDASLFHGLGAGFGEDDEEDVLPGLDPIVPPPPDPFDGGACAARRGGGRRGAVPVHERGKADAEVRVDGGRIAYYARYKVFEATCERHKRCRVDRVSCRSSNADRPGQGRPLGLLAAWLAIHHSIHVSDAFEHLHPFIIAGISREQREAGRARVTAAVAGPQVLAKEGPKRIGEPDEPEAIQ